MYIQRPSGTEIIHRQLYLLGCSDILRGGKAVHQNLYQKLVWCRRCFHCNSFGTYCFFVDKIMLKTSYRLDIVQGSIEIGTIHRSVGFERTL